MKQDKKEKRNNILYSVLGFVLGIALCGIGIYGMILNRIESQEYKNTTDKREVIAVVESCREIDNSDDKDKNKKNSRSVKYRTKLAFEVDGKAYESKVKWFPNHHPLGSSSNRNCMVYLEQDNIW